MSNITITARDGRVSTLEHAYIRGSKIRFVIMPDMLKNAPMFKRVEAAKAAKAQAGRGLGLGRGRATAPSRGGRGTRRPASTHARGVPLTLGAGGRGGRGGSRGGR